jgi:hypothetical protein
VIGYPRFFPPDGRLLQLSDSLVLPWECAGFRYTDQLWLNEKIEQANEAIQDAAEDAGFEYVHIYDAGTHHELCNDGGLEEFVHHVDIGPQADDSLHPNAFGYTLIANQLRAAILSSPPAPFASPLVLAGQTVSTTFQVVGGPSLSVSTDWPGSDVVMTLTTPGGATIDRSTVAPGIYHKAGADDEIYLIADPEPGTWTVELYGADVPAQGERVDLRIHERPVSNARPVARMSLLQDGRTISLDASRSTDVDGEIVSYLWDLAEGQSATGPQVTHAFPGPGTYLVTLVVTDDQGGRGFATAEQTVVVPDYTFEGFFAPVDNQPTVNMMNAGRAVPVKFSLTGDRGLNIFDPGYPVSERIDCASGASLDEVEQTLTAGRSSLTYDLTTDRYTFVWDTKPAWAGTCRRLIVALNDGETHAVDFQFR